VQPHQLNRGHLTNAFPAELAGTTLEAWDDWLAKRISSGGDSEEESAEGEDSEDESTASEHAEGGDTEGETLAECVEGEK